MEKEFFVANNVKDALELKNDSSQFLAGGTEINRLHSTVKYSSLVSIKRIGLDTITKGDEFIRIGACCTFQSIIDNRTVPMYLKNACYFMASRTKRNMATIGGNIALLRSDSYLIPTLVVANAKLELQNKSRNPFYVDIIDYVQNNNKYTNSLILSVNLPKTEIKVCSKRCANTVLSHACITVALSQIDKEFSVFAALKNSGLVSITSVSNLLLQKKRLVSDDVVKAVSSDESINFIDDIFGSVGYKKYLLGVSIFELYKELKGAKA